MYLTIPPGVDPKITDGLIIPLEVLLSLCSAFLAGFVPGVSWIILSEVPLIVAQGVSKGIVFQEFF